MSVVSKSIGDWFGIDDLLWIVNRNRARSFQKEKKVYFPVWRMEEQFLKRRWKTEINKFLPETFESTPLILKHLTIVFFEIYFYYLYLIPLLIYEIKYIKSN